MHTKSFFALCLAAIAGAASAAPIEGARLYVANDGEVFATYLGNSASYSNDLYLDSPTNSAGLIFNNHASPVGTIVDLGYFTAGSELLFRLHVNNTGDNFYTGDAIRNADNHAHARVDFNYSPTDTLVEFEDLINGPYDYNDLSFSFTNVRANPTTPGPEAMVVFGMSGIAALRRRAKKRA